MSAAGRVGSPVELDAKGLDFRALNARVRAAIEGGARELVIVGALGQRYIGTGVTCPQAKIEIRGVPGNDLAAFMSGPRIVVRGNAQDAVGNTMNAGTVVVHGDAGDLLGHSMRGGTIYVRGSAGYRVGIHMKAYGQRFPVVVVGGAVRDYAGEYMAGGLLVILGLGAPADRPVAGRCVGTGMHNGEIWLRRPVAGHQLGKEVGLVPVGDAEWAALAGHLAPYCAEFNLDPKQFQPEDYVLLRPTSHRPYGTLYVY
jgi:glutamate synthase domain-containing protein 3